VDPGPDERRTATDPSRAVAGATRLVLQLPGGGEVELPEALVRILRASADELSAGR
jgi:hypothetical protein